MVERNAGRPEAKRIVYRIGVNLGDVLIEGDDILGDGVNIAARLEGLCEPGGVLISGTAYDHVRGKIEAHFVDLGDKDLTRTDSAIQTLPAQHADFDFHHVEPTGVFGCVMKLQALEDAMRLGRREGFI